MVVSPGGCRGKFGKRLEHGHSALPSPICNGQGYGQGLNYDLGQQNLGLGMPTSTANINNDNLNWQMQGNLGLNIYDRQQASQPVWAANRIADSEHAVELLAGFSNQPTASGRVRHANQF